MREGKLNSWINSHNQDQHSSTYKHQKVHHCSNNTPLKRRHASLKQSLPLSIITLPLPPNCQNYQSNGLTSTLTATPNKPPNLATANPNPNLPLPPPPPLPSPKPEIRPEESEQSAQAHPRRLRRPLQAFARAHAALGGFREPA
jgi:hypothetical protein